MKLKLFFVVIAFLLCSTYIYAQGFSWAQGFTAIGGMPSAAGIGASVFDANNNIYSIGGFSGTVDVDQSSNVYNLTASVPGALFILKQDAAGNFQWAKPFLRKSNIVFGINGTGISLDANNNIYIAGTFTDTVDFDPGPGTYYMTPPLSSTVNFNTFIVKLNPNGDFVWAKQIGGAAGVSVSLLDMKVRDAFLYFYAASNGNVDVDPGVGIVNLSSGGIIEKLDTAGIFIWAKQGILGASIQVDSIHNLYGTSSFVGTVDFDPGINVLNFTAQGISDIAIVKLDSAGNLQWARQIGDFDNDRGQNIAIDRWGNCAVTGYFNGTVDFDPGPAVHNLVATSRDAFTLSLTTNGDYRWAKSISLPSNNDGRAVATDTLGNVYMAGADGPPLTKYDSSGNVVWQTALPGLPAWVGIDHANSVYTTGNFSGTQDFDPGPGVYNLSAPGLNGGGFIQKLCQASALPSITASADSICVGDTAYLITPPIAGGSYYWYKNSTIITGANANTFKATISGSYSVYVYDNGCPAESVQKQIVVIPKGQTGITLTAPSSAQLGQQVTVTAAITDSGGAYTIDWYNNNVLFATTSTPSVTFIKQQPTEFINAWVYPTAKCYDSAFSNSVAISTITSLQETLKQKIQVYPNPVENGITIEGLEKGDVLIFMDITGRSIDQIATKQSKEVIDVHHYAPGYYMLKILSKEGNTKLNTPVVKR